MEYGEKLLKYLKQGIDTLLKQNSFDGGQEFRRTQKQALKAYKQYLSNDNYTSAEKLKGFFEIPTGVGKTAVFVGIVAAAHKIAQGNGEELKTAIVVPTTQLLDQTLEAFQGDGKAFNGFAPWMKDSIGLYGGGKKNLKNPLTIMTYDAFVDLTEAGTIGSHNFNILISDEAHRGTSERRVENITNAFNETTAQLAFTATAHFDDAKSVENSHEREIFYKSVANAIKGGELAAYASSQRYVIRVDPDEFMLSDSFTKASDDRKTAYRRAAKQNAWNKRMVKIFSDGRDEKTGDLLSDNQAGFFVEGTKQADKLELLLNDDLTLVKRAEDMGYEGVAVAIHSKLSKKEQNRRYQAYKEGKYLAVVGDEMFKEGFDHPPMKTIFDCPHSSVVDKAQILGRGLRKWYNDLKDRFEGLTVIDTVIYFGDEDLDVEEKNRGRALLDAVSVKQVLEGSIVGSNDYLKDLKKSSKNKRKANKSKPLFNDDPDVEEYTSLEDLYELEQEVNKIKESYVTFEDYRPISDIDRNIFNIELKRTGLGGAALFNKMLNPPEGLTKERASHIIKESSSTAKPEWVIALKEAYASQENRTSFRISPENAALIKSESERTGLGGIAVFKTIENPPEGFTARNAHEIVNGRSKTQPREYLKAIIDAYASQPDREVNYESKPFSDKDKLFLRFEAERTGLEGGTIFSRMEKPPKGLKAAACSAIVYGNRKKVPIEYIRAIKLTYKKQPDKIIKSDPVLISQEDLELLEQEKVRTGLGGNAIFKRILNPPPGFSQRNAEHIMSRAKKTAPTEEINALITAYAMQPDAVITAKPEKITQSDVLFFQEQSRKTGLKGKSIFNTIANPPKGLTDVKADGIVSGRLKSAVPEHIEALKAAYDAQPK